MNISQELLAIQRSLFDDRLDIYVDGIQPKLHPNEPYVHYRGMWNKDKNDILRDIQKGLRNGGSLISEGDDFIFVSHDPAANMKISFSLKPEPSLP